MASNYGSNVQGGRITDELPRHIKEETIGFSANTRDDVDVVTDLLQKYCNPVQFSSIEKTISKTFGLSKMKVKPELNVVPRAKKTHLSLHEKRKLGLYKLPRTGLKYEEFLQLHELWRQYMLESLDFSQFSTKTGKMTQKGKQWEQLSSQLLKADYHGAMVTVIRSKCPSQVGIKGIVVMDTKNTFKVLGKDNVVRTAPKESSIFQIQLDKFKLAVYGQHLCIKPADRSTKKIRNYVTIDF